MLIYITNFTNNVSGEYLYDEDEITGFESMTLANINGLPPKTRFESEYDMAMESVDSSRFLTLVIDIAATVVFLSWVSLQVRWRVYPSDYAIKLTNISREYKGDIEKDIKRYFEPKYGKIHEVAVVKETGDILKYQMQLYKVTQKLGDVKAKNEYLGQDSSTELRKYIKKESKLNDLLTREIKRIDSKKMEIGGAHIKEVYVIFEMPIDKNKLLQNPLEINDFIEKAKNPKKRRFM